MYTKTFILAAINRNLSFDSTKQKYILLILKNLTGRV